jgi:hypothetical protein
MKKINKVVIMLVTFKDVMVAHMKMTVFLGLLGGGSSLVENSGLFRGVYFHRPNNAGSKNLRHTGQILSDYTVQHPGRKISSGDNDDGGG